MAPPAKRRKRTVVESSSSASSDSNDDEVVKKRPSQTQLSSFFSSPASTSNSSPAKQRTALDDSSLTPTKPQPKKTNSRLDTAPSPNLPSRARTKSSGTKSVSSSPEKKNGKAKQAEKSKSGDLLKLFSSQARRQNSNPNGMTTSLGGSGGFGIGIKQEEIDDLISDEDDLGESKVVQNSIVGAAARKRGRDTMMGDVDVVSASQKFLRKTPFNSTAPKEEDMRPWAERFAPTNLEELAVHKKKVADVRSWLESVMHGQIRQRLLVLKGAAGTGKTTTLQLLAQSMGCNILEWRNPGGSVASSDGFVSMAAQFGEFISIGGRFGQLDLISEDPALPSKPDTKPLDRRKNWIVVEEFPNTFTRSSSALRSFRSVVLQFLATNTPSLASMYNKPSNADNITPLIMVVSETLLTTTSASADSFTAHRLLGPEILQHPGVAVIEFNAIASTFLTKALDLVVLKESRKSGRRKTPGPLVLKRLGEIGDVRSAIGSLEFLCVRGDDDGDWGSKVTFGKGKRPAVPLTKMEEESLELVTRREASLGIFHAVGKVVHNKRDDISAMTGKSETESLPPWMSEYSRPKRSQVAVDELIDETGTDTQTFIAALHENYILSCEASPNPFDFSDLDHVNGCIDALSDSDLLCPSWDGSFNSTGFGGGTGGRGSGGDIPRQDELCFQIAVRGLLFSLPSPVKRRAPAAGGLRTGRGGDAFKMFYPTSLKLWRMKEEIESTIDLWVTRLMKGGGHGSGCGTTGAAAFAKPKQGGIESWRNSRLGGGGEDKSKPEMDDDTAPLLSIGSSARKEMLLERLPYMVIMARANRGRSSALGIRDMEKVTSFTGIGGPGEDSTEDGDGDGDDGLVTEEWATDKPVEGESPKKKRVGIKRGVRDVRALETKFAEQKLVLSDDDIEDD